MLETKHFSEGVSINEQGEFSIWFAGKPRGIPSPLEQNDRHIAVLQDVFKTLDMPTRLGIRLQPYMTALVVLGVATAALGGVLFGPIAIVHPAMGMEIMTVAFVVVVIGGLGSFWGVVAAALLVGVVRGITTHFMPAASEASMYVLMFLVLMFRPRGLLGERIERFE